MAHLAWKAGAMTLSEGFIEYINGRIELDEYLSLYPNVDKSLIFVPKKRRTSTICTLDFNRKMNPVSCESGTEWLDRDPFFGRLW